MKYLGIKFKNMYKIYVLKTRKLLLREIKEDK